jgi:chromosome segregation ATPase
VVNWQPMFWSMSLLCFAAPLFAQVERSGGQNAQMMQQYQQLAAERTKLKADNAALTAKLEDADKQLKVVAAQLAALKARGDGAQAAIAAAQKARNDSEQTLKTSKDKLQDLLDHYRDIAATLREVETKRVQLDQQLTAAKAKYDQCAVRNEELARIGDEVLTRYEHQSAFGNLARAEPFTRITQTRIENLVDEYRDRAQQLRLEKQKREASPPRSGSAPDEPKK